MRSFMPTERLARRLVLLIISPILVGAHVIRGMVIGAGMAWEEFVEVWSF